MNSNPIAETPRPPYYAVIFTSVRNESDSNGYALTAARMIELASEQDGFLGVESVRDENRLGITVSYWKDEKSIQDWHAVAEHRTAQELGRSTWYQSFSVRISRVERDYSFGIQNKTA